MSLALSRYYSNTNLNLHVHVYSICLLWVYELFLLLNVCFEVRLHMLIAVSYFYFTAR